MSNPSQEDWSDSADGREEDRDGEHRNDEEGLVDALVQASFAVVAVLTRIGAEHDLSLTQLRVLAILRDRRLRMSVLADYLGLDKSTLSGLVDRAAKRGLLQRASGDGDGRVVEVLLTEEGMSLAQHLYATIEHALAPLTGRLTTGEQRRLHALLTHMLADGETVNMPVAADPRPARRPA